MSQNKKSKSRNYWELSDWQKFVVRASVQADKIKAERDQSARGAFSVW